jgi:hypothetical protein
MHQKTGKDAWTDGQGSERVGPRCRGNSLSLELLFDECRGVVVAVGVSTGIPEVTVGVVIYLLGGGGGGRFQRDIYPTRDGLGTVLSTGRWWKKWKFQRI